jgi:hypothetical protein
VTSSAFPADDANDAGTHAVKANAMKAAALIQAGECGDKRVMRSLR